MSSWTSRSTRWARTAASVSEKPGPALSVGIATVTPALMLDYPAVQCSAPSRQQRRSALDSGVSRLLGALRRCLPSSSVSGLRGRWWFRRGSRPTSSLTSPTRRAWQRASCSRGIPAGSGASSDESFADASVGASRGAFWPQAAPPDWSRADYDAYLAAEHAADRPPRDNGSGPSQLPSGNPPLYYVYAAVAYLLDHGGTAFGRLYAIRIAGVLLLALTTLSAWLLAGEVFGRRRLPQLTCAAVAGLMPMVTFMSTAVNPDALAHHLVDARPVARRPGDQPSRTRRGRDRDRRGHRRRDPGQGAVLRARRARRCWRCSAAGCAARAMSGAAALKGIAGGAALLCAPVLGLGGPRPVAGRHEHHHGADLRGAPVQRPRSSSTTSGSSTSHDCRSLPRFRTTPSLPVYEIWVRQGVGTFGWLVVALPRWIYLTAAGLAGAIAVASIALLAASPRPPAPRAARPSSRSPSSHCWASCTSPSTARCSSARVSSCRAATCSRSSACSAWPSPSSCPGSRRRPDRSRAR